jgi:hypothetical protein
MKNSEQDSKKKDIPVVNLVSYSLWAIPYTKEDKMKAEKNLEYARDTLEECIKEKLG